MKKILLLLLLSSSFIASANAVADNNWNTYEYSISGTTILVNEYKYAYEDKVILLPGGAGITDGSQEAIDSTLEGQTGLAEAYAAKGKQLVFLHIPYFEDGRDTIEKASQEVLNIIDAAIYIGYLKQNYTLVGGSAGTLMISAMLDFNQLGETTNQRLIDNVGRVVMLAGPHNNAQDDPHFQNEAILDLMNKNNVTTLTSLNTNLNLYDRWTMYLDKLVNSGGLRIVVGGNDNKLCKYDSRCDVSMDIRADLWVQELTRDTDGTSLYGIYDIPNIAKVVEGAGHDIPLNSFKDFIMN